VRQIYHVRIRCDVCGAEADTELEDALHPAREPEGWINVALMAVTSSRGVTPVDLCPKCAAAPFATVISALRQEPATIGV
jgi:hypothetical protein